ncbi:spermidine synthase [Sphingomonas jinjuensis]|uniref:Spermidine synthase n=1 Tax=Sphingomonas jinjuensis TaxID=535907 RepID=A0A840FKV7_9SPHN|nr:spermidine synthase [Sphingomonas jinjuensis]MBB4153955.1 spermidine synthase [Sphingomonas jinjuensis]
MDVQTAARPGADDPFPWGELIDTADIPGGGKLHLYRHEDDYEILFGEDQLMGSWAYRSEEALATLVADRLDGAVDRVLIGGLGMGFTLASARAAFAPPTRIVVSELVPQVVAWAKGHLASIVGNSLLDPRVTVEIADVHDMIVAGHGQYDAILLDVDNGPDGLIHLANERLYCDWGLRAAHAALRPGGMLAIWSAYPDDAFSHRLRKAGFRVETRDVDGGNESEPPHVIWLAAREQTSATAATVGLIQL